MATLIVGTNSYATNADAEAYFDNRVGGEQWLELDVDDAGDKALITASSQISRMVIDSCKLPLTPPADQALQDATFELSLSMLIDNDVVNQSSTGSKVKNVKAGSAEVEFFSPVTGSRFPSLVMDILRDGECISGIAVLGAVATGTTVQSQFDDCDKYRKSGPFA